MNDETKLFLYGKGLFDAKFDRVTKEEFYHDLFSSHAMKALDEKGKPNIILACQKEDEFRSYSELLNDDFFKYLGVYKTAFVSPALYFGRTATFNNLRVQSAIVVDLDGVSEDIYYTNFLYQIEHNYFPKPTYVIPSGHGLHLYYMLENPIEYEADSKEFLYKHLSSVQSTLATLVYNRLTSGRRVEIVNKETGAIMEFMHPDVGFPIRPLRAVGSKNKLGYTNDAYLTGKKYMNVYALIKAIKESFLYKKSRKQFVAFKEADKVFELYYTNKEAFKSTKDNTILSDEVILDNAVIAKFIPELERKIVTEVKPGARYFSLFYLTVDYIKAKKTNAFIKDRINALANILNEKACKNHAPFITSTDTDAIFSMLKNRSVYEQMPLSKKVIESVLGISFDLKKQNAIELKREFNKLKKDTSKKKESLFLTDSVKVLNAWRRAGFKEIKNMKEAFTSLGINHKVYDKWGKKVRALMNRIKRNAIITGKPVEVIFNEEMKEGKRDAKRILKKKERNKEYNLRLREELKGKLRLNRFNELRRIKEQILNKLEVVNVLMKKSIKEFKTLSKLEPRYIKIKKMRGKELYQVFLVKRAVKLLYSDDGFIKMSLFTNKDQEKHPLFF